MPFTNQSGSSQFTQRTFQQKKRYSPYTTGQRNVSSDRFDQNSSASDISSFNTQKTTIPVEAARALVRAEQSSSTSSSHSQDVMDRLQKRDLSIFKTGDKSSTSETIDLEPEEPVVNIKEEAPSEVAKMEDTDNTQFTIEDDTQMSNSQIEYDQGEYDESYAGMYILINSIYCIAT